MKVWYSDHAKERMAERGISPEQVEALLTSGHTVSDAPSTRPGYSPRKVYRGRVNGRNLKVVLVPADIPVIVTAAWADE
jgi:hypothetical protein